jgi:hypothetical protein
MENQDHLFNHIGPLFAQEMANRGLIEIKNEAAVKAPFVQPQAPAA